MTERRFSSEVRLDGAGAFIIAAAAGLGIRLLLAFTTIGTNDVLLELFFATMVEKYSVVYAYDHVEFMNHPPLSVLLMSWYLRLASFSGLEFPVIFRAVQSVADVVTAAALYRLTSQPLARFAAIAFLLCPAAIVISGFHSNTDPMMVALLVIAVLAAIRGRLLLSGVLLALSFHIKIVAVFAAPLIFLAAGRRRWAFAAGFLSVVVLLFAPTALLGGPAVLVNVLGYSGWRSVWGIGGLMEWMHHFTASGPEPTVWLQLSRLYSSYGTLLLGAALLAFYWLFWRRLRDRDAMGLTLQALPIVYLIVLSLAPRFGVQYLVWPLPLLPFALARSRTVTTCLVFAAYLIAVYTIWSGGFPWWYADAMADRPMKWVLTDTGFLVWAWVVFAAADAIRRLRVAAAPAAV